MDPPIMFSAVAGTLLPAPTLGRPGFLIPQISYLKSQTRKPWHDFNSFYDAERRVEGCLTRQSFTTMLSAFALVCGTVQEVLLRVACLTNAGDQREDFISRSL